MKVLGVQLLDCKAEAQKAQNELVNLNARDDEKDMIEGQYFIKAQELKTKKAAYKELSDKVKELKSDISEIKHSLESNKNELVSDFEKYQEEMFESLGQTNKSIVKEESQNNENENAIFFNAIQKAERFKKKASLLNKRK